MWNCNTLFICFDKQCCSFLVLDSYEQLATQTSLHHILLHYHPHQKMHTSFSRHENVRLLWISNLISRFVNCANDNVLKQRLFLKATRKQMLHTVEEKTPSRFYNELLITYNKLIIRRVKPGNLWRDCKYWSICMKKPIRASKCLLKARVKFEIQLLSIFHNACIQFHVAWNELYSYTMMCQGRIFCVKFRSWPNQR